MKCLQCGQEFKPPPNNPAQKFCSRPCYEMHRAKPPKLTEKCAYCGRKFTPPKGNSGQIFCSKSCYNKHRAGIQLTKPKPKKKNKPLELWIKEADECNLDYGTYRALINLGKTFEELKATAHLRALPTHSHKNLGFRQFS